MKHLTAILAATALLAPASAGAQTTQKLTAGKSNEYGLIYTLPLTALDITIEAEHVVRKPGEFYKYALKYLDTKPVTEPSETWTVKSVTVNPRGVADQERRYLMQFKNGSTPFIIVNDENLPLAINTEQIPATDAPVIPVAQAAQPTPLETPAARQAVTEEMLQSQSTAKRAELAAAQIYALRQSRTDLITGQADQMPPDGNAMKLILDNINAQEAALTAMFLGTEQHSTEVETVTVTPTAEVNDMVVARLSALDGITDADDLTGSPIYLNLAIEQEGEMPVNEKGEEKRFPKGGVAYAIPGTANATVSWQGRDLWSATVPMSQFGVIFGLDPGMFTDKKAPAYLLLDPVTGAIRELGTK
ncbi:MAG: DUF4831 family protein [Pseudoflavonifractor sp.]|nr:DUF4831 family protein [Pseudoflavonifractor sp.]